jgi:hypothetical protein
MRLRISSAILLLLALTACGGQGGSVAPFFVDPGQVHLAALDTPENTPEPSPTALVASLTPTQLFTPELPTPESQVPTLEVWAGQPTYVEESEPGLDFRVNYNSSLWALIQNETGFPALAHREIPYCQIVPTAGRGLSRGWTVDSTFRTIGTLVFEVATVSQEGQVKFVNYFGRSRGIVTGFQVSFLEQMEACLANAETVFVTLTSAPAATPTPSPTFTPEPTLTSEPSLTRTP